MKQRFNALDLYFAIKELATQVPGTKLVNIYDHPGTLNPKGSLLFKFARGESRKINVIIEPGIRVHSTDTRIDHESGRMPGGFVAKLRKHLRGRTITGIQQLGFDRLFVLEFDMASSSTHTESAATLPAFIATRPPLALYVELYAAGNLILVDKSSGNQCIALFRSIDTEFLKVGIGLSYKVDKDYLTPGIDIDLSTFNPTIIKSQLKSAFPGLSANILDSFIRQLEQEKSVTKNITLSTIIKSLGCKSGVGYLMSKNGDDWFDFSPVNVMVGLGASLKEFPSFNLALDTYFGQIQERLSCEQASKQENLAARKLATIEQEQQDRMKTLSRAIHQNLLCAQAIECNLDLVRDALIVCCAARDQGMNWIQFNETLQQERLRGTAPVASRIKSVDFGKSVVILELSPRIEESPLIDVALMLHMTPHANASRYYELKKQAEDKLTRTKASHSKAIKAATAKIEQQMKEKVRGAIRDRGIVGSFKRRIAWYEKFAWFVSSDGFLIIGGKDAQQNDLLFRRYLRACDLYVHADLSGAGSIIIRNHLSQSTDTGHDSSKSFIVLPPPKTLIEAGTAALCQSKAWSAKIVTSAWWVYAWQVSKTAPSGEYLGGPGSFMIRGQKNFLPPAPLVLGLTFVWTIVDDNLKQHRKDQRQALEVRRQNLDKEEYQKEDGVESKLIDRYMSMLDIQKEHEYIKEKEREETITQSKRIVEGDAEEVEEEETISIHGFIESDLLTGAPPLSLDGVAYALPMVAPYSTLTNENYMTRVKLIPTGGNNPGKKGRIAKQAVSCILTELPSIMHPYIKSVPNADVVQCIPNDCKIGGISSSGDGEVSKQSTKNKSKVAHRKQKKNKRENAK